MNISAYQLLKALQRGEEIEFKNNVSQFETELFRIYIYNDKYVFDCESEETNELVRGKIMGREYYFIIDEKKVV